MERFQHDGRTPGVMGAAITVGRVALARLYVKDEGVELKRSSGCSQPKKLRALTTAGRMPYLLRMRSRILSTINGGLESGSRPPAPETGLLTWAPQAEMAAPVGKKVPKCALLPGRRLEGGSIDPRELRKRRRASPGGGASGGGARTSPEKCQRRSALPPLPRARSGWEGSPLPRQVTPNPPMHFLSTVT